LGYPTFEVTSQKTKAQPISWLSLIVPTKGSGGGGN
jgi:hypothetical protein